MKRRFSKIASIITALLTFVLILFAGSVFSQPLTGSTWTGSVSTAWQTAGNWSTNAIPTTSTDAIVPTSPSGGRFPTISVDGGAKSLTIQTGATVTQTGGILQIANNWDNSGTFNASAGNVQFTNSGTIGGTASTVFNNLVFGTGAAYTLNTNGSCSGLTFNASGTASSFTHSTGVAFTVNGAVTINQPTAAVTTA